MTPLVFVTRIFTMKRGIIIISLFGSVFPCSFFITHSFWLTYSQFFCDLYSNLETLACRKKIKTHNTKYDCNTHLKKVGKEMNQNAIVLRPKIKVLV